MELNGFLYNQDRKAENKIYWRCEDRQCNIKGRVITIEDFHVKNTSHTTHAPGK